MKNIKNILSTPENTISFHNTITMIYLLFGLFVCVITGLDIEYLSNFIMPLVYVFYFLLINTSYGKRKFDKINLIMSIISFIGVLGSIIYFIDSAIELRTLYDFIQSLSYIVVFLFYSYWLSVFFLNESTNKKVFKTEKSNLNISNVIIISNIGLNIMFYLIILFDYGIEKYLMIDFISSIFLIILFILRVRYIYLYQEHVSKRRDYYV